MKHMTIERKNNLIVTLLIAALVAVILLIGVGCSALGIGTDWYAIDPVHLAPDVAAHALPTEVPVPGSEPERTYVVIPETDLPPDVDGIPLGEVQAAPAGEDWTGAIAGALGALGPWGALGGALLAKLLGTRRGRANAAQAAKSLAKLRPVEAVRGVLAADGWIHTDEVPARAPAPPPESGC